MYVIFDLHVWRGQERGRVASVGAEGEAARARAYDAITFGDGCTEEDRQAQRDAAVATWHRVIVHFRGALLTRCSGSAWAQVLHMRQHLTCAVPW